MWFTSSLLIAMIAIQHVLFLILEMFLWTKPLGLKVFRQSPAEAKVSAVVAANQGLYNGFLAAGLAWSLLSSDAAESVHLRLFFLSCVIVAGVYGAYSVSVRILFVQALPALLALTLVFLSL